MKIAVAGIGYVGMANACLLAQKNDVIITDIIQDKVDLVNQHLSPINDTDIISYLSEKSCSITAANADSFDYGEFDYVIVATPTDYDIQSECFNTKSVESVIEAVIRDGEAIIVVRSTVPIGFTDSQNEIWHTDRIIFAPEFLREGKALHDALNPSRIIVGGNRKYAEKFAQLLLDAADKKETGILVTGCQEAEAIKLFSNAYLAMRVAYINEIDTFAMTHKLDARSIIDGVCLDTRIGGGYNNPSFGYGGYCLPKDTKQLKSAFKDIPSNIISSIVDANESRKNFIAEKLLETKGIIGIYRIVMKAGSDNFRDSSIVHILKTLVDAGREVVIYEPMISDSEHFSCRVCNDIDEFKKVCDIVAANRVATELADISDKVMTRDLFGIDL